MVSSAVESRCNGSSACEVLLQYAVPGLGCVFGTALVLSPFAAVKTAYETQRLGKLNTLPYALMVGNAFSWIGYSWFIRDWFVFFGNIIGWIAGMFFTLLLLPLAPRSAQFLSICVLVGVSSAIQIIYGTVFVSGVEYAKGEQTMGIVANIVLVSFYGSPLSVCVSVIKEKDSTALSFPLALTSLINGSLWTAYGIAIGNPYIGAPNALGVLFSIFQMILLSVYPKKGHGNDTEEGVALGGRLEGRGEVGESQEALTESGTDGGSKFLHST
ncbi:hypothetical protein BCR33DRAFT_722081 [Rhizoclosmatium globosum]|uniref:Sugar transporter SWEET1 n=1 Tax=Rhizoclosmatium globosum TaxID=329046 RepID=A0A1Y2BNH0_9FUNG|nr:hypothetical protein HDU79_010138 [Rhizoclosmatium sp. JEL0117]ORY36276.1 hypothetical protein BCR33DRAFT_722081 [Rhizoclosmatium globosum]|eukprot:ORY36276.1 hypothetical protein BCR33DRAFT_722081 [Rhizoclosmatium globosum]